MKKSTFTAMILGTVSAVIFALGMCMTLLPEWDAFQPGVICIGLGLVLGLITFLIWWKMAEKDPARPSGKTVGAVVLGVSGALTLGIGMSLCLILGSYIWGIAVGLLGILLLMCLIPLIKGLK